MCNARVEEYCDVIRGYNNNNKDSHPLFAIPSLIIIIIISLQFTEKFHVLNQITWLNKETHFRENKRFRGITPMPGTRAKYRLFSAMPEAQTIVSEE